MSPHDQACLILFTLGCVALAGALYEGRKLQRTDRRIRQLEEALRQKRAVDQ